MQAAGFTQGTLSPCAERPSRLPAVEVLLLLGGEGVDGQAHGGQLDPADGVVDFGGHLDRKSVV